MCAGLYPNVSAREEGIAATVLGNLKQNAGFSAKSNAAWYDGKREVHIHPSSINSDLKAFQYPFLVFLEKVCIFFIFFAEKLNIRSLCPYLHVSSILSISVASFCHFRSGEGGERNF